MRRSPDRPAAASCVGDATLFAFDTGQLPLAEATAVMAHLDGCGRCRARLDGLARTADDLTRFLREGGRRDGDPGPPARGRKAWRVLVAVGTVVVRLGLGVVGWPWAAGPPPGRPPGTKLLPDNPLRAENLRALKQGEHVAFGNAVVGDPRLPFADVLRVGVGTNPGGNAPVDLIWTSRQPVPDGHMLTAALWARAASAPDGQVGTISINACSLRAKTPKSVLHRHKFDLTTGWVYYQSSPFRVGFDPGKPHGRVWLHLMLADRPRAVEVGGLSLVDLGLAPGR